MKLYYVYNLIHIYIITFKVKINIHLFSKWLKEICTCTYIYTYILTMWFVQLQIILFIFKVGGWLREVEIVIELKNR